MKREQRRLIAGLVIVALAVAIVIMVGVVVHFGPGHPDPTPAALPGANPGQTTAAVNHHGVAQAAVPVVPGEAKAATVAAPVKIRAMEILASAPAELRPTPDQTQRATQIATQAAQDSSGRLEDIRTKQRATLTALRQAQAAGNGDTVTNLQQNLASQVGAETALRTQTATQVNEQVATTWRAFSCPPAAGTII
jgi:hypothetical protein